MVNTPVRSSPSGSARARRTLPIGRAAMATPCKTADVTAEGGGGDSEDSDDGPAGEDRAVAAIFDIIVSGVTVIAETRVVSTGAATDSDASCVGKRSPPGTTPGPGLALATCIARSNFEPGAAGTSMETGVAARDTGKAVGFGLAGVAAFLGCCGCGLGSTMAAAIGTKSVGAGPASAGISMGSTRSEAGGSSSLSRCAVIAGPSDAVGAGNGD
jgi:hypothetical protein